MTDRFNRKQGLLLSSGAAALALGLASVPQGAAAQGIQATPTVVQGAVNIDRATPGVDTITVESATAVVDWQPDEISGTALTYLPNGNTAIFQNNPLINADFAILNRILPSTNNDVVVFDGQVISRLQAAAGGPFTPGGTVAFYSPTGIFVGSTALFDVGQLLLTSVEPSIASFNSFAAGGTLNLVQNVNSTPSDIQIAPGAVIVGTEENSYFVAVAGQSVSMDGLADINGSTAYIAGEQVNLTYNAGLFDIVIPVGTNAATAISHGGITTGPASTGTGDNHVIYGVAAANANPIGMFFEGNLGFAPAVSAGVDNGDIILSANFDVFGRSVAGGVVGSPIEIFSLNNQNSNTEANIQIDGVTASSSLAAVSTDDVLVQSFVGDSTFDDNVTIMGRNSAIIASNFGNTTTINGDVRVSSNGYGDRVVSVGPGTNLNGQAGLAQIVATNNSAITIDGEVEVQARGFAGEVSSTGQRGDSRGGTAAIQVDNATINISGVAAMRAGAERFSGIVNVGDVGDFIGGFAVTSVEGGGTINFAQDIILQAGASLPLSATTSGVQQGGFVDVHVRPTGGNLNVAGNVDASADAGINAVAVTPATAATGGQIRIISEGPGLLQIGGDARAFSSAFGGDSTLATGGDAQGGDARISSNGGDINIDGIAIVSASASGGAGISSSIGSSGTGGIAFINILQPTGQVTIDGTVDVSASASGGDNLGGEGGIGTGGQAQLATFGGTMNVGGSVFTTAQGDGGDGVVGGLGRGGIAGVFARFGAINIVGGVNAGTVGTGGNANLGFGGDGGNGEGGNSFIQAEGDANTAALISVGGLSFLDANGRGGEGGSGDGSAINPGAGGDGIGGSTAGTNPANPGFNNGAFALARAESGTIILADALVRAEGFGGSGGAPGTGQASGAGGNALGGTSQAGTFFQGGPAATGSATFGNLSVFSSAFAGAPGADGGSGQGQFGGATGGGAFITARGTSVTAASASVDASGINGGGPTGAVGGFASITSDGGLIDITNAASIRAFASGASDAFGNDAVGGQAVLTAVNDGTLNIGGFTTIDAAGLAGNGQAGGDGTGGFAILFVESGTATLQGNITARTDAFGGDANVGFGGNGGLATGGSSVIEARGTLTQDAVITIVGDAFVSANAFGGDGGVGDGSTITPGAGGNAVAGNFSFQDPNANATAGAYIYANVGRATLTVGNALVNAFAQGGDGGNGGPGQVGGAGGDAFGGTARSGVFQGLGASGAAPAGSASFTSISADGGALGGAGGQDGDGSGTRTGAGGNATAGIASVTSAFMPVTVAQSSTFRATGRGGAGGIGGTGTGGLTGLEVIDGGDLTIDSATIFGDGIGGTGNTSTGGDGTGGTSGATVIDGALTVNGALTADSSGAGGLSAVGNGSAGTGGLAGMNIQNGTVSTGGTAQLVANGFGGSVNAAGATAGVGTGGTARITINQASDVSLQSAQVVASGQGGTGASAKGGDGFGGTAELLSDGSGSTLVLLDVIPFGAGNTLAQNGVVAAVGVGGQTTGADGVGGNGTGGNVVVSATNNASLQFAAAPSTGLNRIISRGNGGGSTVDGGTGGLGTGGSGQITADTGGNLDLGPALFSVFGFGGSSFSTGLNVNGGNAIGGTRAITVQNGATLTMNLQGGTAGALGGEASGTGDGGDASGGNASLTVLGGTLNLSGQNIIIAQNGAGGGQTGGDASGGTATVVFDGGAVVNIAPGGVLAIAASNFAGIGSTGNGGDAVAGTASATIADAAITGGGALAVEASASGGSSTGGNGGSATGGSATLNLAGGSFTGAEFGVSASAFGGSSTDGTGGNAQGGIASFLATGGSVTTAASFDQVSDVTAEALGGSSTNGSGGDATAGDAQAVVSATALNLAGIVEISASASGGNGATTGGNAQSGGAILDLSAGSSLSVATSLDGDSQLNVLAESRSGEAPTLGDTISGSAVLGIGDSSVQATNVTVSSNAALPLDTLATASGSATAGTSQVQVNGTGSLSGDTVQINASAFALTGSGATGSGTATGGGADLDLNGGALTSAQLFLETNASGGDQNEAGDFNVAIDAGTVTTDTFTATATGDTFTNDGDIRATGGSLLINNTATINLVGDLQIETANGNIIGGPTVTAPTANITINSGGTVSFDGDNDNVIGFGGDNLSIASDELDINLGARIGANIVSLTANNTGSPAILGGTTEELGYTLTAEEAERIEAGTASFFAPAVNNDPARDPDVVIRDLTISGSLDDGPSQVDISTDGILSVEGLLSYVDAASTDSLFISANERLQIITPTGGIIISDSSGQLSGSLSLFSNLIIAATADLAGQIANDPDFDGVEDALIDSEGIDEPRGFIRGGSVSLSSDGSILIQNTAGGSSSSTGSNGVEFGGVTVGDGGLEIFSENFSGTSGSPLPIRVIAFGAHERPDGSLQTGEEFFGTVDFAPDPTSDFFTDASTFNNCVIVSSVCTSSGGGSTEEEIIDTVNNPNATGGPVGGPPRGPDPVRDAADPGNAAIQSTAEDDADDAFSMDFPGLIDSGLVLDEDAVDQPVTSGGDTALYALGDDEDDDDEDDEDGGAAGGEE